MIQNALFFILGVLLAVFVLILLAPTVWRRAVLLARRQFQAALPVSLGDIEADRDSLRAEYAVALSVVEQKLALEKRKTAEQQVKLGRQYDELKRVPVLEADVALLAKQLDEAKNNLTEAVTARDHLVEETEILASEVEQLQNHLNALQGLCDTLRIEISAKEAEHSRLSNELSEMRRERKSAAMRYNEVSTQLTATQTELKSQKRRNEDMQQKLDRLITDLSDAQEKIERHNRLHPAKQDLPDDLEKQNAVLREEMAVLAAQMVKVTADQEGEGSPIHQILQTENGSEGSNPDTKSLASRIKGL